MLAFTVYAALCRSLPHLRRSGMRTCAAGEPCRVAAAARSQAGARGGLAGAPRRRSAGPRGGGRFARDEGVPLSTLRALGRPGAAGLVSELDPDAPTRCAGSA